MANESQPNLVTLVGYLEEALPAEQMTQVERCLREDEQWQQALAKLAGQLDFGEHSVATIWRRHRLTCPSRQTLGAYLVGGLDPSEREYIQFHLEVIGCRWCQANLEDLRSTLQPDPPSTATESTRGQRFFESSVGLLAPRRS